MPKTRSAKVTILESFDLGRNTGEASGMQLEIFDIDGRKLGTMQMGQGTFCWYAKNAKTETKNGKLPATLALNWSEFADLMNAASELGKKDAIATLTATAEDEAA